MWENVLTLLNVWIWKQNNNWFFWNTWLCYRRFKVFWVFIISHWKKDSKLYPWYFCTKIFNCVLFEISVNIISFTNNMIISYTVSGMSCSISFQNFTLEFIYKVIPLHRFILVLKRILQFKSLHMYICILSSINKNITWE